MNENLLGDYLRKLRLDKDITTRKLGEKINYSYSYIASMEKGRRNITSEFLEKYIYSIAENKEELTNIKKEISNLTEGKFYNEYFINNKMDKDDSMIESFLQGNGTNNMFSEEGSLIIDKNYNFPINDIYFNLNDKYNSKFFGGIKLSDNDRKHISSTICIHLLSRFESQITHIMNEIHDLQSIDKHLYEEIEELKQTKDNDNKKINYEIENYLNNVLKEQSIKTRQKLEILQNKKNKYENLILKVCELQNSL